MSGLGILGVDSRWLRSAMAALLLACALATPSLARASEQGAATGEPRELRVLFVGNSYTFGLAETVEKLARAHGKTLVAESVTEGGFTLSRHVRSGQAREAIRGGGWDYVVLQEQSQRPSLSEEERVEKVYPFAVELHREIEKAGAVTLFYETWGRDRGDTQNRSGDTFEAMQGRLTEGYARMAALCEGSRVVPVGQAWALARSRDGSVALHHRDGSHPGNRGRYLTAAVFYRAFYGEPVEQGRVLAGEGVPEEEARFLQGVANAVEMGGR